MSSSSNIETAPPPGSEPEPEPEPKGLNKAAEPYAVSAMITKERVPDCFVNRIKAYPSRKMPPFPEELIEFYNELCPDMMPDLVESEQATIERHNYFVDLEQDCLRQLAEKGYAEVGVDYSNGIKQLFILPR